jgi:hypothetical protein
MKCSSFSCVFLQSGLPNVFENSIKSVSHTITFYKTEIGCAPFCLFIRFDQCDT